jgi:hypothetical protein
MKNNSVETTSRLSYSESELKELEFTEENYFLLIDHLSLLPHTSFPFIWKTGISLIDFNSVVQESWHFKGVFKEVTGEVIIYKNSPTSFAHEIPNGIVNFYISTFNLQLNNSPCEPIRATGGGSIVVNGNTYTVDGSFSVFDRTVDSPNVILEHSYTNQLVETHNNLVEILQNTEVRSAILFDSYKYVNGSFALVAYTIRKNLANNLYVPRVVSYGNASPTVNTINFLNSLNPQNRYGIGLSINFAPPAYYDIPQYQIVIRAEDLLADCPPQFLALTNNNEKIQCVIDLGRIGAGIMSVKNWRYS